MIKPSPFWKHLTALLVIGALLLVIAACGGDEAPPPTVPAPTATTAPTETPVPPTATPEPPTATPTVEQEVDASPLATPEDRSSVDPSPLATPEDSMAALDRLVERSIADLAETLEIDAGEISVVETEATEWPDASLGCPEDGMMYAQVITSGYHIVLEANGQEYEYHTSTDPEGRIAICE